MSRIAIDRVRIVAARGARTGNPDGRRAKKTAPEGAVFRAVGDGLLLRALPEPVPAPPPARRPGPPPAPRRARRGRAVFIAFMKSSYVEALPALTTATGSTLPFFSVKIVISAFLRSPFSSNSISPVAPS